MADVPEEQELWSERLKICRKFVNETLRLLI